MITRPTTRETGSQLTKKLRGFSLIELLLVIAIILIIAAIAIPNLLRSRIAAHEAAGVEDLRAMTTAATAYSSTWGNGYPPTLAALGGIAVAATCDQAVLLDSNITTAPHQSNGYTFSYTGVGATIAQKPSNCSAPGFYAYLATAVPASPGVSAVRSFCSDLPGVIHYDITGAAIASPAACDALPSL